MLNSTLFIIEGLHHPSRKTSSRSTSTSYDAPISPSQLEITLVTTHNSTIRSTI
ncbi:hypothetical protein I3843_08G167400 [Carya illinoinensis]|nr:hypothetical protein I3843_08G167400 [Carya illinoinensis]